MKKGIDWQVGHERKDKNSRHGDSSDNSKQCKVSELTMKKVVKCIRLNANELWVTSLNVTSVRSASAGGTLIKCWNFKEVMRCKNRRSAPEGNN